MIVGIGVDAVDIVRFIPWTSYSHKRLHRIFSASELDYCFSVPTCTTQRLAVRFAAREAFFKALSSSDPHHVVPFLTICRSIVVEKTPSGAPYLKIDWPLLQQAGLTLNGHSTRVHISLTHTRSSAIAWVMIIK